MVSFYIQPARKLIEKDVFPNWRIFFFKKMKVKLVSVRGNSLVDSGFDFFFFKTLEFTCNDNITQIQRYKQI